MKTPGPAAAAPKKSSVQVEKNEIVHSSDESSTVDDKQPGRFVRPPSSLLIEGLDGWTIRRTDGSGAQPADEATARAAEASRKQRVLDALRRAEVNIRARHRTGRPDGAR